MSDVIYLALFNPMIHESSYGVISVHKTRKGAEMAVAFHKSEVQREYEELYSEVGDLEFKAEYPFDQCKSWAVHERILEP